MIYRQSIIDKIYRFDKMADKNNKINDEKRLIELIMKVFKEEFAQQEKNISNLIGGNFSITKQQLEEEQNLQRTKWKKK